GAFDRGDLVARLLAALETNSLATVRLLGERLALDPRRLELALERPAKALAGKRTREIALIALSRLARNDPADAMQRLEQSAGTLRESDLAFVRSQVAASAMRQLDPRALEWARASLDAPASDHTWAW